MTIRPCPTVHFVCGPTASGKSTHARRLAAEHHAVRFAIDDWMHRLFAEDRPARMDLAWVMARVARCQQQIWATCTQILTTGTPVVLELGLMRAQDRQRAQALAEATGCQARFHFTDADRATRWQRVQERNLDKGATYSFEITQAMFDVMEKAFEPPSAQERAQACVVTSEPAHD
jgi:predicted kinase